MTLAVKMGDPLYAESLIVRIVEAAAKDVETCRELVDDMSADDIVAIARVAAAFMPPKISTGPSGAEAFMELLTAAMQSAAVELEITQLAIEIQPLGMPQPTKLRVVVLPEELSWRRAKSQPLGKRTRVQHGG